MKIWFKELIVKLVLLYALVKVVLFLYSIYDAYFGTTNPLIPSYLSKYVAFPTFFLIPIWLVIALISWKLLKRAILLKKWFVLFLISIFVFQFSEGIVYSFLMEINPYG